MNRALFAGLSGTVAFQSRLDVVGNNIANANTVAYKEGRTTFQEALYETLQGGRSGSEADGETVATLAQMGRVLT